MMNAYGSRAMEGAGTYVAKVYAWFTLGIAITMGSAWAAVSLGSPVTIPLDGGATALVPPAVALVLQHPIVTGLGFLGLVAAAAVVRRVRGLGAVTFMLFAVGTGVLLGPSILFAQLAAKAGTILSANPVRDAFILSAGTFLGLTAYALVSRRNFSFLGGFLWTGLMLTIVASVIGIFLGSRVFDLTVSSVAILVFVGYVLYDTSNLLHGTQDDPIGDALNLHLDFLNLFVHLLRILASAKSSD